MLAESLFISLTVCFLIALTIKFIRLMRERTDIVQAKGGYLAFIDDEESGMINYISKKASEHKLLREHHSIDRNTSSLIILSEDWMELMYFKTTLFENPIVNGRYNMHLREPNRSNPYFGIICIAKDNHKGED